MGRAGAVSTGHLIPGYDPADEPPRRPTRPAPEPSHAERARTLMASQGRGALSTIALEPPGSPFGSVVTYGLDDAGRPSFFVSTLAEHTRNLDADKRASLLVVEDTPAGADPLASARVTLVGTVGEVTDADERAAARAGYLAANPSAFYVDYGDFRCLRLEPAAVRYVGGFGRMSWVDAAAYAQARPDPLAPAAAAIIGHMNADHADALVTLCHHHGGRPDVETGLDDGGRPLRLRGRRRAGRRPAGGDARRVPHRAGHRRRRTPGADRDARRSEGRMTRAFL
jgi:putative heme iron utilization protein